MPQVSEISNKHSILNPPQTPILRAHNYVKVYRPYGGSAACPSHPAPEMASTVHEDASKDQGQPLSQGIHVVLMY